MRIYTNTDIITNRSKWAKRVTPLTLLFLVAGLITNFMGINQPEYIQLTMILLLIGFVLAFISSYLVNRWVREPRSDQVLSATLKKFGNDFALFNYTSKTSHVLLTPSRLYAVAVKNQDGQISVNGRRFSRKFAFSRLLKFFADEGMGTPHAEAESLAYNLAKLLHKVMPDEQIPEIKPLIIFSNKNVDLIVNNPDIPVMRPGELKTFLREQEKSRVISAIQRQELIKILAGRWQETKE